MNKMYKNSETDKNLQYLFFKEVFVSNLRFFYFISLFTAKRQQFLYHQLKSYFCVCRRKLQISGIKNPMLKTQENMQFF